MIRSAKQFDLSVDVEHIPGDRGRPAPFMIYYAMTQLDIQSIHEVLKIGDTPADMLEGYNAGCRGRIRRCGQNHVGHPD